MFNLNLKKISLTLLISLLFLVPFLNFNNSISDIKEQNYELRDQTIPRGSKIFKTSYIFEPTSGTSIISIDYVIGRGDGSINANIPKYMALTSNPEIPAKGTPWTDVESTLISSSYSPTNWEPTSTTDETEITNTTIYHSDLVLQNLPSDFDFDKYYVIFQSHGTNGTQYTYYDLKPLNYMGIEEPQAEETTIEIIDDSILQMHINVNAGFDPYGDPWVLNSVDFPFDFYEKQGLNIQLINSSLENNFYSVDIEISGIEENTVYKASSLSLEFSEPYFLKTTTTVNVDLPGFSINPTPKKQKLVIALIWLILFIVMIVMVAAIMLYKKQLKN